MSAVEPPVPPAAVSAQQTDTNTGQMEGSQLLDLSRPNSNVSQHAASKVRGVARHTLGLLLLLLVVFLWTASNFLGSTIFADNSFAKPFFVTYLNTACFILPALPTLLRQLCRRLRAGDLMASLKISFRHIVSFRSHGVAESEPFLKPDDEREGDEEAHGHGLDEGSSSSNLSLTETAKLSFEFCILWFLANYFAMGCLQHTTVASATIITSTSSVWTLLIGTITKVEKFTIRKLLGVFAALLGVVLISRLDYTSTPADDNPDSTFPDKSGKEIALGDAMAFLSAFIYGIYTIVLKIKVGSGSGPNDKSSRVNMPLFFGLVGTFNLFLLWPMFPILSATGIETFELPPSGRIWTIVLVNSASSLISDIAWAYAMILTSPLVVTVGLSLTIPLSLVGEMIVQSQFKGWWYWVGALVVVAGFGVVEGEGKKEELEVQAEIPARDSGAGFLDES